jgi:hypothetical protein
MIHLYEINLIQLCTWNFSLICNVAFKGTMQHHFGNSAKKGEYRDVLSVVLNVCNTGVLVPEALKALAGSYCGQQALCL